MNSGFFGSSAPLLPRCCFLASSWRHHRRPAQGLQCASNPLIGTWRLNLQNSTLTRSTISRTALESLRRAVTLVSNDLTHGYGRGRL